MRHPGIFAAGLVAAIAVTATPVFARQSDSLERRSDTTNAIAPSPAGSSDAPSPTEQREWFGRGLKWANWSRMTGDWDRLRTDLDEHGWSFQIGTISDVSSLATPSRRPQGIGRQLTTIGMTIDLEKAAGLKGSRVLVQYQSMGGANGAIRAATTQGFSNIDADAFSRFGEVWFEQRAGASLRIKTGLIDANKDFAFVENGADFINSSMGYSPTIFPLPTYPDPHMGLVVRVDPAERFYAVGGLFNGGPAMGVADFSAVFAMGEAGLRWKGWGGGRIGIGYWHVGGRRADPDDVIQPVATGGQYVVLDQTVWSGERDGAARSIGAFFQAGLADPGISTTSSHVGGGVVARGFVAARPDDSFGVGLTTVRLVGGARESEVGAFYRLALTKWMALKPDVQFIRSPGGASSRRFLVAGTVRIEVGF
ncbi:MAG: carbohydrate porin [Acidobacteriota bacterium]